MAEFIFQQKSIGKATHSSIHKAVAYRTGEPMVEIVVDPETGIEVEVVTHYANKGNIVYHDIMAPEGSPSWVYDRQSLWDHVADAETRKNSVWAEEIMLGIPKELNTEQAVDLVREFIEKTMTSQGIVADFSIHWEDGNPHVHILQTTRDLKENGFGKKNRSWHRKDDLKWKRKMWDEIGNKHLKKHGIDERIDHRSYKDRGLDIEPLVSLSRASIEMDKRGVASDVVAENKQRIANRVDAIKSDPSIILKSLSQKKASFTETDIAKELFRYTHGHEESFSPLMEMIKRDGALVTLPEKDLGGKTRYSYRPYFEKEQLLIDDLSSLSVSCGIAIGRYELGDTMLSSEQEKAVRDIVENDKALSVLVGKAGTGKTRSLRGLADVYQSKNIDVYGMATSGIAAKELGDSIGVPSRTIASWKQEWENTPERIPSNAVLIIDEAGMVDVENMAYMARIAKEHHNTIIGVGDSLQFQAIGTGNAFSLMQEVAPTVSELSSIRRQDHAWMREASEHLSRHDIEQGITPYAEKGHVHLLNGKERLYHEMVDRYLADERKEKLILAYSLSDVKRLNDDVRKGLKRSGKLTDEARFQMQDGEIGFALGDRILFKKNEYRELDVRNGQLGDVVGIEGRSLKISVDDVESKTGKRIVTVDTDEYKHLRHGYAITSYGSQGVTVDSTYMLADKYYGANATYVGMTRHRDHLEVFADSGSFKDMDALVKSMGRISEQDVAVSFIEKERRASDPSYVRVRDYVAAQLDVSTLEKKIRSESVSFDQPLYQHPLWKEYQEEKEKRNAIAREIHRNRPKHSVYLREAGIRAYTLNQHAGEKMPVSEYEREEREKAEKFMDAHYRVHHEKDEKSREVRDEMGNELFAHRMTSQWVVEKWLKDNHLGWKDVEAAHASYVEGIKEKGKAESKEQSIHKSTLNEGMALRVDTALHAMNGEERIKALEAHTKTIESITVQIKKNEALQGQYAEEIDKEQLVYDKLASAQRQHLQKLEKVTENHPNAVDELLSTYKDATNAKEIEEGIKGDLSLLQRFRIGSDDRKDMSEAIAEAIRLEKEREEQKRIISALESSKVHMAAVEQNRHLQEHLGRYGRKEEQKRLQETISQLQGKEQKQDKGVETSLEQKKPKVETAVEKVTGLTSEIDAMQQEIDRFNSWQRNMKHVSEYLEKADTHYKESASILLESAAEIKEVIKEHAKDNDISKKIISLLDAQDFEKVQKLWDSLDPRGSKLFGSQEKHVYALRMQEDSIKGTVELYTYHKQDRERKSDYEKQHQQLMKEKPLLNKQKAWSVKEKVEAKKKEVQQLLHTLKEKDLSDTMKHKLSQQGISKEQDGGLHLGR